MKPVPYARRAARRHAWLRVLVVLVALFAAGTHTEAVAAPPTPVYTETYGAEDDVLDAAPQPPATLWHRAVASLRPGPRTAERPSEPDRSPAPAVRAAYSPARHAPHTMVLRC